MRKKGRENESMTENEITNQEVETSGEEDLIAALASLKLEDNEDEIDTDEEEFTEEEDDSEAEEEQDEEEYEEEVEEETPPAKKKQSKEDNAKFAAQRRQAELDRKVQEKLDELKQSDPNFLLAQTLSEQYGETPENILAQLKEAQLQEQATKSGIPIEHLRKQQETDSKVENLENELNALRFQAWQSRIEAEAVTLKGKYTMLSDEDIEAAETYLLNTVRNVDMPLSQAVYALHGEKIIEGLAKGKVQDDLASKSGRKAKNALPPNNSKPAKSTGTLSAEEKAVARAFGISEADYLKNKR